MRVRVPVPVRFIPHLLSSVPSAAPDVSFVPQVDPKLVMEQAEREGGCGKSTFLYQLHRLIVLSS